MDTILMPHNLYWHLPMLTSTNESEWENKESKVLLNDIRDDLNNNQSDMYFAQLFQEFYYYEALSRLESVEHVQEESELVKRVNHLYDIHNEDFF